MKHESYLIGIMAVTLILSILIYGCGEGKKTEKKENKNPTKIVYRCIDNKVYKVKAEEIDYEWYIIEKELIEECNENGCKKGKCLDKCEEGNIKNSENICVDDKLTKELRICENGEYITKYLTIYDCTAVEYQTYQDKKINEYKGMCNSEGSDCDIKLISETPCESYHLKDGKIICNENCKEGDILNSKICEKNDVIKWTKVECKNDIELKTEIKKECNQYKKALCLDDNYIAHLNINCTNGICDFEREEEECTNGCKADDDSDFDYCNETCNIEGIIEKYSECSPEGKLREVIKYCKNGYVDYKTETTDCENTSERIVNCENNYQIVTKGVCVNDENGSYCGSETLGNKCTCIDDKHCLEFCNIEGEEIEYKKCSNNEVQENKLRCENRRWNTIDDKSTRCNFYEETCEDNKKTLNYQICKKGRCVKEQININQIDCQKENNILILNEKIGAENYIKINERYIESREKRYKNRILKIILMQH